MSGRSDITIQLLIRDGAPNWWESPDISVVPGADPSGPQGEPEVDNPAHLWAMVTNEGDEDAPNVSVDFWVGNPALQIRRSNSNLIGTTDVYVETGTTQNVLCPVSWTPTLNDYKHGAAVVVEANSPGDPLSPPPADPDVLNAQTYRQIAQRNLKVGAEL